MRHIQRCVVCSEFTMQAVHCEKKTMPPQPVKYVPDEKYAHLKREAKESERKKEGLL